jgi:hypothetical protein
LFIAAFSVSILLDFSHYLFVSRQTEDGAKDQKEDCLGCHTEDGSNVQQEDCVGCQTEDCANAQKEGRVSVASVAFMPKRDQYSKIPKEMKQQDLLGFLKMRAPPVLSTELLNPFQPSILIFMGGRTPVQFCFCQ